MVHTQCKHSEAAHTDLCGVEVSLLYKVSSGKTGLHTEKKNLHPDENLWSLVLCGELTKLLVILIYVLLVVLVWQTCKVFDDSNLWPACDTRRILPVEFFM